MRELRGEIVKDNRHSCNGTWAQWDREKTEYRSVGE